MKERTKTHLKKRFYKLQCYVIQENIFPRLSKPFENCFGPFEVGSRTPGVHDETDSR